MLLMATARITSIRPEHVAFKAGIVLAMLLLVLGVPRLAASLALLPGDAVRDNLASGLAVSSHELAAFMASRAQALSWIITATALDDEALGLLTRAEQTRKMGDGKAAMDLWRQAQAKQEQALARAPAMPYGWARLAYLRLRTEGLSSGAVEALTHSLETAPYEKPLLVSRMEMAFQLEPLLPAAIAAQIPHIVRAAWALDKRGVRESARARNTTARLEKILGFPLYSKVKQK